MSRNFNIKAIVFDLGGVLFSEGISVASERLFKENNYDKEIIRNILACQKSRDLRGGFITDEEFWDYVQKQTPKGYDAHAIKDCWYNSYILDEDVFNLVKDLRGKYKLIVFSGNIKSRVEYLDNKYGFRKYFDLEIYSYDHHFNKRFLNKPKKEAIDILVEESGFMPEEMIYIDDDEEFLKIAENLGIKTIVYKTGNIIDLKNKLKIFGIK